MSAQHTPGPWKVLPAEAGASYLRIRGTRLGCRYKVANVHAPAFLMPHDAIETEANARLIGAAPRMRELLQEALMPDLSKPLRDHAQWLKDVRDLLEDEIGDHGGVAT